MSRTAKILFTLLIATSIFLRVISLPHENGDTAGYLQWYDQFAERGSSALADNFSVYTPPYLYLLWFASWIREILPPLLAVKLIPNLFDFLSGYAVYRLIRLKYPLGDVPFLAAAGYFLLPTILVNSSYWGEVDSLYTSFILLCIYMLLTDRPFLALSAFGIALSVKAQAVFIMPALLVLAYKSRIPWRYFLITPVVYLIMMIPAIMAGRPILETLTIYFSQANTFTAPSMNAPNLYSLIIYPPYYLDWEITIKSGLIIAVIAIIAWIVVYARRQFALAYESVILIMLVCLSFVPFVLPKMHDRYFYPADGLSYVFAFYYPAYWFIPILFQVASGIMYYVFLAKVDPSLFPTLFPLSAGLSTIAVVTLLVKQFRDTSESEQT